MRSNYDISMIEYTELEYKIVVPKFQRRLVWSKKQKQEFIETLSNGYPFGSILIYKYEDNDKFSLIDGLQRFSTIKDFKDHPEEYIDLTIYTEKILDIIGYTRDKVNSNTYSSIRDKVDIIVKSLIKENSEERLKASELFDRISSLNNESQVIDERLSESYIVANLCDIQGLVFEDIAKKIDIQSIKIPCIEFKGDQSELAIVFENLNRGGKKLSKYQVFAAQWSDTIIRLNELKYNQKIERIVIDRYEDLLQSREIEIEDFDAETIRNKHEINLSEFCYAYGMLIIESLPAFFQSSRKNTEDLANELGYSTLAIVLKKSNKKLHEIIAFKKLFNDDNGADFIENIVEKTLDIYGKINKVFDSYFKMPGISSGNKCSLDGATNFQIMSYFASIWSVKYSIVDNKVIVNENTKTKTTKTYNNLIYYYLEDLCNNYWSGAGDGKLDKIYIDGQNRYTVVLSKDQIEASLLKWFETRLTSSIQFDHISKSLITLYSNLEGGFTFDKYEFEHIIPRKIVSKDSKYKKYDVPAGSLGNIMLLDEANNKSKKDRTLYDLKPGTYVEEKILERSIYPSHQTLVEVIEEIENEKNNLTRSKKFIENRGREIITSIVSKLYK